MKRVDLEKYQDDLGDIACNLCGNKKLISMGKETRFHSGAGVSICPKCSLVFISPRWSEKTYSKFYQHDYRILMGKGDESLESATAMECIHGSKILDFCSTFVNKGDKVLDVGSSAGGVLHVFKRFRDCKVIGLEPDLERAKFSKDFYDIEIKNGLFEQANLPKSSFDLVIMTQTLNHLLDPYGSLEKIREILKPEGKVFLEVQNFAETIKLFPNPTQVDHTYNFTPETLTLMLRKIGFEILNIEEDTAATARMVSRYMQRRGANIHIRIIAQKAKPAKDVRYPNYHDILRNYYKYRIKNTPLLVLLTIKSKITKG